MQEIIFPILGVVLTNLFGLNILKSYLINRKEIVQDYNEILFYIIIFNTSSWLLYGTLIKDIFIFTSSILTLIFSFGFIQIMYKYIKLEKLIYIEIISLIGIVYLIIIIFLLNFTNIDLYIIQYISGVTCTLTNICANAAPLLIIKQVIITKNTSLIYLPQAIINFINYLCWLIYAINNHNIFLLIPNSISLCLCLFQIIVYGYVKLNKKNDTILLL
jgi:solute carrier family 50 protein (sugar transporter)